MSQLYEAVYIIDSHLPEEAVEQTAQRISDFIAANGGSLKETNRWGKRRMAYEIKRKQHGIYYHFLFESDSTQLPNELNAQINPKIVDAVLRHLIIRVDPHQLAAMERLHAAEAEAAAKEAAEQAAAEAAAIESEQAQADEPESEGDNEESDESADETEDSNDDEETAEDDKSSES